MVCNPLNNASQKQKLILAAIASFTICMILSLYFHHYDSEHWAYTVDSIDSGNGIYGLNGFYYPPLYGYILSFLTMIADALGIPIISTNPIDTEAPIVLGKYMYYHPAFPIMFKLVNAIASVVIGYLIYRLVEDCTRDKEMAYRMSLLWYLCPIVIQMIGVQGQFDVLAIMTGLMCIIALRRESYFLAGTLFGISVLLKVFFGPCIIALVLYIWLTKQDIRMAIKYVGYAAIGAIMVAIVAYVPLFIDGTWVYSLTFFSDRASREWYMTLATVLGIIPMICMMILCVVHMIKSDPKNADKELIIWSALLFGMAAAMSPGYQYGPWTAAMTVLLWATMNDKRLYRPLFWGTAIFSCIQGITITHFYQMWMGSYFWGVPDYTIITELSMSMNTFMTTITLITSPVYVILLALIMLITLMTLFEGKYPKIDRISEKIRSLGGQHAE
ncbi:MAG: DUF2029 domain-containing protein [Thermoplasmata archaeon]|nr:DUF2029 domain-containing protein [Thermoplasmata archaeon]